MNENQKRYDELIASKVNRPGLRGRIDAKCIECVYWPTNGGTWRQQVQACTSKTCPLYPIRATSEKEPK